jgi:predicted CXXCH cytochrome family protein
MLTTRIRALYLAGAIVFAAGPVLAVEVDIGPEMITMESTYKKPALFPHRKHQGWYGCTTCHHTKGQVMTIAKCEPCHNRDVTQNTDLDSLRKVAHQLCRECHKKEREKGRDAPSSCRVCHVEQNQ